MRIILNPLFAKIILRLNPFRKLIVVCKGYDGDDENYTELVWEDDQYIDFYEKELYFDFELWSLR